MTAALLVRPSHSFAKESDFQAAVIQLAHVCGWRVMHTRPAMTQHGRWSTPLQGDPGFPDLVLARRGQLIFAELKTLKGVCSPPQLAWLDELGGGVQRGSVRSTVWRPSDWDEIQQVLEVRAV